MPNPSTSDRCFRDTAFMANRTAPVHRWAPWVAGYSKQFVEDALSQCIEGRGAVLDPFAGVGTTLVEADLSGHTALGFEINPYAAFAARVKLQAHRLDPSELSEAVSGLRGFHQAAEAQGRGPAAEPPAGFRTRSPFYSPKVLRKVLLAQDFIAEVRAQPVADVLRLAFAATMVEYSNYSYEPSLGRKSSAGRPDVEDHPVLETIADKAALMAEDAAWHRRMRPDRHRPDGEVRAESFFDGHRALPAGSVDLVITSPPYLNNFHYGRNTRPHLYWLGFCRSVQDTKRLEELNFGTYWQNARGRGRIELSPDAQDDEVAAVVEEVRLRNPGKGVYGGAGWANYAALYFNDCARFIVGLEWCMRPGATALVVIGNSILQGVAVPTDRLLARIAERRGFEVVHMHTPRSARVGSSIIGSAVRVGKAAQGSRLHESIVELRRP